MHKFLFIFLIVSSFCFSQTLSLESGNNISIDANSSVTINGLVQVSSVTMTQGDYLYSVVNQYESSTSSSTNRINNYGQIGSGNLFVNKNGKIISY